MDSILSRFEGEALPAVDEEIEAVIRAAIPDGPGDFAGMLRYQMGWVAADFSPKTLRAGKKLRPLLCILSCSSAGGAWRRAVPAAAAVEILHNYTLIHDDIIDRSPTRRGRPVHWTLWGSGLAINAGDAMHSLAYRALSGLLRSADAAVAAAALRALGDASIEVTRGQHLDIRFEQVESVSVDEYTDMISGKTAALLSVSCELGALASGPGSVLAERFARFGRALGLAFQVTDDILGIWGAEADTGKSTESDIAMRKKTLPVIYGLSRSPALVEHYRSAAADDFVPKAVALLDAAGARDYCEAVAADYTERARKILVDIGGADAPVSNEALGALGELVAQMLGRER